MYTCIVVHVNASERGVRWFCTVVRIAEGVRTTKTCRPTGEAASEADEIQAAVVRREVPTRQDAELGCRC